MQRAMTAAELVEAWVHARRHVPLDLFGADAVGRVVDGVRVIEDHHDRATGIVVFTGDAVWTLHRDRDGEVLMLRWHEGRATQLVGSLHARPADA